MDQQVSAPMDHPAVAEVQQWISQLLGHGSDPSLNGSSLIDLIRVLEELKSAAAAAQARAAAAFEAAQREAQARAGLPSGQLGRGVGAQIALARRDSPHRGARHLGLGKALVHEMPHTLHALSTGVLSEWRATLLVRETACLKVEDRRRVDALVCGKPETLEGIGDRKLISRIRSLTQAIDPASQVRRQANAAADRYVSCRPAPDTMSYLTGLLPVAQGVAVYAALSRTAESLRATGDERGRGQIMADTLVERVTGQATAAQVPVEVQLVMTDRALFTGASPAASADASRRPGGAETSGSGQAIDTCQETDMRQDTGSGRKDAAGKPGSSGSASGNGGDLWTGGDGSWPGGPRRRADEPAYFPGYGIVPGQWARDLIAAALQGPSGPRKPSSYQGHGPGRVSDKVPDQDTDTLSTHPMPGGSHARGSSGMLDLPLVTLRRLYLEPTTGELVAMDSKARHFPPGLARLIRARDQTCRTPWCDAPIRHIDHIQPHAAGGPTSYTNGQGLCEACNHAKEAPGWRADASPALGKRHTVRTVTPTGHTYNSTAPPLPGSRLP